MNPERYSRADLAGGTLDIWPLYLNHPGAVTVNFAVNRYTTCVLETRETEGIHLCSEDFKTCQEFQSLAHLRKASNQSCRCWHMYCASSARPPASPCAPGSSALIVAISSAPEPPERDRLFH